jgi:hypothetical protein
MEYMWSHPDNVKWGDYMILVSLVNAVKKKMDLWPHAHATLTVFISSGYL